MYGENATLEHIVVIPWVCTSVLWGQYAGFSHPVSPQCVPLGLAAVVGIVSILSSLKAHCPGICNVMLDGCHILC